MAEDHILPGFLGPSPTAFSHDVTAASFLDASLADSFGNDEVAPSQNIPEFRRQRP
jgi:hypothetical protein